MLILILMMTDFNEIFVSSGVLCLQGPVFLHEPPSLVRFSNSTGVVLSCSGHGNPPPRLRWVDAADHDITLVPGLRKLIGNGSLFLMPFPETMIRPEIHTTTYHCLLSNPAGSVLSRAVRVEAVVATGYVVEVADAHTLRGNVAVLRCDVSEIVRDVIRVAGWSRDDAILHRTTIHSSGRYTSVGGWNLHVSDVTMDDMSALFYCQTVHLLTGERRVSSPGRIIISDSTGNVPPIIADTAPSVLGIAGSAVDIACPAQGYPPPSIRWFLDSSGRFEELTHVPSKSVLSLPLLQPQDSGKYACIARNLLGEDRRDITLKVLTDLSAIVRPQHQVVDAGASATFNCSINGGQCSDSTASWRKNGRILLQDRRISISVRGDNLVIRGVRRGDDGMYQCFVTCSEDSVQGTGQLILGAVAPELQSTFMERTLEPGPSASLRCVVSGNPPPRITWLLDGGELRPQGYAIGSYLDGSSNVVSHLNISTVRVQHGGVYTCLARNLLGTAQHSAALNVYGSPSPRPPLNLTVVASTDVMLRCPVAGYPVTVAWSRGNMGLPPGPHHVVLHNGTLLVRQVDGGRDGGTYSCTATSDIGMSAQGRIHLDVMKPPKISEFVFPSGLEEGMRAQVACSLVSGDLPITITWRKDGGPLPQDPVVQEQQLQFVSNLLFSDLAARHAGDYTCIASNAAAVANATATLVVKVAPSWEIEPRDTSVLLQESAAIHCRARGYPTPVITWLKPSGEPTDIMDPSLHMLPNGTLLVRSAERSREGQYTCQAGNGIGTDLTKTIFLRINVPARFRNKVQTQSGVSGELVILSCAVEGDSPLHITWNARHRLISPIYPQIRERHTPMGLVSELHIESVGRRDEGTFKCRASNEFGHDEAVIRLLVKEAPPTPKLPKISNVRSRSIGVSWPGESGANVVIQYRMSDGIAWSNLSVPADMQTARISMLQPGTTYLIRLIAVNEVGSSLPGPLVRAATMQEAPERAPVDVSAEAIGPESLIVRWSPPDPDQGIIGYAVLYSSEGAPQGDQMQRRVGGSHRRMITLTRLSTFTRYNIAVSAFNHIGYGPFSAAIAATTFQGVPDMPPHEVRCEVMTPQSVRVRWIPPPPAHRRGVLEGYRVMYSTRGNIPVIKGTTNLETTLHGLSKASNYSVSVLAYTKAGDGTRSNPIFCITDEDRPGPPLQVKALSMTSDSIVIIWSPPGEPNGNILKYNVHVHPLKPGAKENIDSVHPDGELLFEARRLQEMTRYEFWVTAFTSVGEGRASIKLTQSPLSKVPARIAAWSRHINSGEERLLLSCRHVGLPAPSRSWRGPGGGILPASHSKQHIILSDGSLLIAPLRARDAGNYSCHVENMFGRDEVVYQVTILSVPTAPVLSATAAGPHALHVNWDVSSDGGSPIISYILAWRKPGAKWNELDIFDGPFYLLTGLDCGHTYQLTVTALNAMGRGRLSNVLTINTTGSAPTVPPADEFILVNMTTAVLLLEDWPDGGCPLKRFSVEVMTRGQDWRVVNSAASPPRELEIPGLLPGTWYQIKVGVLGEAGVIQNTFQFATRRTDGGLPPVEMVEDPETNDDSHYNSLLIILPIISGIVFTLAAVICICLFVKRCGDPRCKLGETHYSTSGSCDKLDGHLGQLPPLPPECKAHGAIRERKGSTVSGHDYEICPYATFNLADATQNPPSRDYSMHFRSFNQQDCFQGAPSESVEIVPLRSSKSPPDGLSLEVSCISSQQTLPVRTTNRSRAKRTTENKDTRPWSCPARKYDSDSSERSTTPAQSPVDKHASWKTPRKVGKERCHYHTTAS